jgi:hypothetical protein
LVFTQRSSARSVTGLAWIVTDPSLKPGVPALTLIDPIQNTGVINS